MKEVFEKLCGKYSKINPQIKNDIKRILDVYVSVEIRNLFMPILMNRLLDKESSLTPLKKWKFAATAMLVKGKGIEEVKEIYHQKTTHPLIKALEDSVKKTVTLSL